MVPSYDQKTSPRVGGTQDPDFNKGFTKGISRDITYFLSVDYVSKFILRKLVVENPIQKSGS